MNLAWLISFVSFSFLLTACAVVFLNEKEHAVADKLYHLPVDCDFTSIVTNNSENACTPKLNDPHFSEYVGILINGPKEIIWSAEHSLDDYPRNLIGQTEGPLRLMIAGLMRAKYSTLGLRGQFSYQVLVVAVNQNTAQTYSGKMSRGDFEIYPKKTNMEGVPKRDDYDEYRESLYSSKFNLDLVHDLGIPIADATYTVYATLGEYKSNSLTIKTIVQ